MFTCACLHSHACAFEQEGTHMRAGTAFHPYSSAQERLHAQTHPHAHTPVRTPTHAHCPTWLTKMCAWLLSCSLRIVSPPRPMMCFTISGGQGTMSFRSRGACCDAKKAPSHAHTDVSRTGAGAASTRSGVRPMLNASQQLVAAVVHDPSRAAGAQTPSVAPTKRAH